MVGINDMDRYRLGLRIQQYRIAAGLSRSELAQQLKCTKSYIDYLELGKRTPTIETLIKIADILEVDCDQLLSDSIIADKAMIEKETIYLVNDNPWVKSKSYLFGIIKRILKTRMGDQS